MDWRHWRRYTVDTGYRGCFCHGFYSGEVVTYNVISGSLGQLIDGKNYYVSRVSSNNIRLANSLPDLFNGDFVDATGTGTFKIICS